MPSPSSKLTAQLVNYGLQIRPNVQINGKLRFKGPCEFFSGSVITNCSFGPYSYLNARSSLTNCHIGAYCSLSYDIDAGMLRHQAVAATTSSAFYQDDPFYRRYLKHQSRPFSSSHPAKITIKNDVWIGSHVLIPAHHPVTISTGAVIASGAVVTKDVPPYAVMAGNPARQVKQRFSDEICADLLSSQWWHYNIPLYMADHPDFPLEDPKAFAEVVRSLAAELPTFRTQCLLLTMLSDNKAQLQQTSSWLD